MTNFITNIPDLALFGQYFGQSIFKNSWVLVYFPLLFYHFVEKNSPCSFIWECCCIRNLRVLYLNLPLPWNSLFSLFQTRKNNLIYGCMARGPLRNLCFTDDFISEMMKCHKSTIITTRRVISDLSHPSLTKYYMLLSLTCWIVF